MILESELIKFYLAGNKASAISISKNSDNNNSKQDLFEQLYSNEYNLYKSSQDDERQLNDNLNFPLYGDDDLMRDLISFNLDHNLRKKRRQFTSNLLLLKKNELFFFYLF